MTELTKIGDVYNLAIEYFDLKIKNGDENSNKNEEPTKKGSDENKIPGSPKVKDEVVKEVLKNQNDIVKDVSPTAKARDKKNVAFLVDNDDIKQSDDIDKDKYMHLHEGDTDTRKYILTDESHNDLWLLHNVTVNNYFEAEETLKYAVFFLRPKCLTQKALIEVQEESLGMKKTLKQSNDKQGENDIIKNLLKKFENKHKNMQTYSLSYYRDPKNEIKNFKSIFSIDFTNFIFNILILIIMVIQLFLYMDTKSALLKQAWASNQKLRTVYTPVTIKTDLIQTLNQTITDCKLSVI